MSNTSELYVLKRMKGKTIGEAYKALEKAKNAYNERFDNYCEAVIRESQIMAIKEVLKETE